MLGRHLIKAWSATQASIALSSGEAEYYGVVRGVGIALGMQALYRDIGLAVPIRVWTDSSAAIGIAGRQGLGKLRHLECHSLWVQQRLRRKEFKLMKVAGEVNPADLFTKHLESRNKLDQVVGLFGCRFVDGRAATAPALKSDIAVHIVTDKSRRVIAADPADPDYIDIYDVAPHDPIILPHQYLAEDIIRLFPEAIADPPRRGETDTLPIDDLSDPVPKLLAMRTNPMSRSQKMPQHRPGLKSIYADFAGAVCGATYTYGDGPICRRGVRTAVDTAERPGGVFVCRRLGPRH